jgi:hypothetical protein
MRVRVLPHSFWPDGAVGTVRPYPPFAAKLAGGAAGCSRVVRGKRGPVEVVWMVFDRMAQDGEGDGPYREGEILAEYLQVVAAEPGAADVT